jgi:hypothetical protein
MDPHISASPSGRVHAAVYPGVTLVRRPGRMTRSLREDALVAGVVTSMVAVATLVPGLIMALTGRVPDGASAGMQEPVAAVGLMVVALAAAGAVCGFGLIRMHGWAWPGGVVVCALQVMVGLLRFAIHEPVAGPVLTVGIGAFALYYLLKLEVRAAFGRD